MNDDLLEDLDAYVGQLDTEPEAPTMDDDLANRLLRRIRRQEITRGEVAAVAKAERDRIDAWERNRLEKIAGDVEGMERVLDGYMRAVKERRKLKTLKLPNGELRIRPARTSTEIIDADAARAWLLERATTAAELDPATVAQVLAALTGEKMLRVSIEPAKGEIGKATEAGPVKSEHEDLVHLVAVLAGEGEAVPGVLIERPTREAFSYSTAKRVPDAEPEDLGHDVPTQGGTDDDDRT